VYRELRTCYIASATAQRPASETRQRCYQGTRTRCPIASPVSHRLRHLGNVSDCGIRSVNVVAQGRCVERPRSRDQRPPEPGCGQARRVGLSARSDHGSADYRFYAVFADISSTDLELRREWSTLESFAISFSIISICEPSTNAAVRSSRKLTHMTRHSQAPASLRAFL
jgi:hypothetical protein